MTGLSQDNVGRPPTRVPARMVAPLQKWRLKRVFAYVEENLAGPITLADLAGASGLTQMYFAAQFRAAVGMRPHDYILRRRIERAQERLREEDARLIDIALEVGFQTQAHFTTVFRKIAGTTPSRWRTLARNEAA